MLGINSLLVILATLVPPLLWASVNYVDKFLLSHFPRSSSKEVLMLYSAWFSILVLPFAYLFAYESLTLAILPITLQLIGGLLLAGSIHVYLYALDEADVSVVIPLSLLTPVFGFFLAIVVLGEHPSIFQVVACLTVIVGALLLTLERSFGKFKIQHIAIGFMLLNALFQSTQEVLFKFMALGELTFATAFFWLHAGLLLYAFLLAVFRPESTRSFVRTITCAGSFVLSVNVFSEALSTIAYAIRDFMLLLAPVILVMTMNSFQPLFVLLLGYFLSIRYPQYFSENITRPVLFQRSFAVLMMVGSSIFLASTI